MNAGQTWFGLYLDEKQPVDKKIHSIRSNDDAVVADSDGELPRDPVSRLLQFDLEGSDVRILQ